MKILTILILGVLTIAVTGCSIRQSGSSYSIDMVAEARAEDVLIRAISLVGTPYAWGGNTPQSGFDCSGLIVYVYRETTGVLLPRTTSEMFNLDVPNVTKQALKSGDLVFFSTQRRGRISHAGIYVGEGRFVHAPSKGGTVRLERLNDDYWKKVFVGGKRIFRSV